MIGNPSYNEQRFVDAIVALNPSEDNVFGGIFFQILQPSCSLFACPEKSLLFVENEDKGLTNRIVTDLIDAICFIRTLERHQMIYISSNSTQEAYLFQDSRTLSATIEYCQSRYNAGGSKIRIDDAILEREGNEVYGSELPSRLSAEIYECLCCPIYATSKLRTYKLDGYKTVEAIRHDSSIQVANRSLKVAIFALILAILTPCLSTWILNKFGYSTINKEQFEQLIESIPSSPRFPADSVPDNTKYISPCLLPMQSSTWICTEFLSGRNFF